MQLRPLIETECDRFAVPGAAVAVVAAGEVVLSEGFGRRDDRAAVTSQTRFMLASDTKCFAAASVCLLAEQGLLSLDEPVQSYVPWFAMHDERVSEWVTCRDLLAHRTGLPRHDLMTIGNGDFAITNEQIARRMRHLEAARPFREGFGYSNVHYCTAGYVAEVVTGVPWPELVGQQILGPLGMSSTTSYDPALTAADFAVPHVGTKPLPFQTRRYDLPSGGLVTTADDLAQWLLARLGDGRLSDELLRTLHAPAVVSGAMLPFPELHSLGYALGCMVFAYRGHRLVLHGGSQIGFSTQVIVLPDAGIGVAIVTNSHGSQLPLALGLSLVDELLGVGPAPWGERLNGVVPAAAASASSDRSLRAAEAHVGTFSHPAYGELELDVQDGQLRADFHGLGDDLSLTHHDGDEWRLEVTSVPGFTIPLIFEVAGDGSVVSAALVLGPALPQVVFARV